MTKEQSIIEHITRRAFIVEQALHGDIVEQAIRGDGGKRSVREAITWAMEQGYLHGKESGIAAEREACAEICDGISEGYETRTDLNQTQKQVGQLAAEVCGVRIRERGKTLTKEQIGEMVAALPQGLDADEFIYKLVNWAMDRERQACIDLCDKIEIEANSAYHKNYDAYEDGVSAGARACMEEIARRGK